MSDNEQSISEEEFEELSISDGQENKEITINFSGDLESSNRNPGSSP